MFAHPLGIWFSQLFSKVMRGYTAVSVLKMGELDPKEFIWLPKITQSVTGLESLDLLPLVQGPLPL